MSAGDVVVTAEAVSGTGVRMAAESSFVASLGPIWMELEAAALSLSHTFALGAAWERAGAGGGHLHFLPIDPHDAQDSVVW